MHVARLLQTGGQAAVARSRLPLIKGPREQRDFRNAPGHRRRARPRRPTSRSRVDLDGTGRCDVATGIGFLDHMLDQLARHSRIDITVKAKGDLHIDHHHTTEDVGIVLGQAVQAGARRHEGHHPLRRRAPADGRDADAGGARRLGAAVSGVEGRVHPRQGRRDGHRAVPRVVPGLRQNAGITLHVETLYGENNHHIAETCFKALARALRAAVAIDPRARDGCRRPRARWAGEFSTVVPAQAGTQ